MPPERRPRKIDPYKRVKPKPRSKAEQRLGIGFPGLPPRVRRATPELPHGVKVEAKRSRIFEERGQPLATGVAHDILRAMQPSMIPGGQLEQRDIWRYGSLETVESATGKQLEELIRPRTGPVQFEVMPGGKVRITEVEHKEPSLALSVLQRMVQEKQPITRRSLLEAISYETELARPVDRGPVQRAEEAVAEQRLMEPDVDADDERHASILAQLVGDSTDWRVQIERGVVVDTLGTVISSAVKRREPTHIFKGTRFDEEIQKLFSGEISKSEFLALINRRLQSLKSFSPEAKKIVLQHFRDFADRYEAVVEGELTVDWSWSRALNAYADDGEWNTVYGSMMLGDPDYTNKVMEVAEKAVVGEDGREYIDPEVAKDFLRSHYSILPTSVAQLLLRAAGGERVSIEEYGYALAPYIHAGHHALVEGATRIRREDLIVNALRALAQAEKAGTIDDFALYVETTSDAVRKSGVRYAGKRWIERGNKSTVLKDTLIFALAPRRVTDGSGAERIEWEPVAIYYSTQARGVQELDPFETGERIVEYEFKGGEEEVERREGIRQIFYSGEMARKDLPSAELGGPASIEGIARDLVRKGYRPDELRYVWIPNASNFLYRSLKAPEVTEFQEGRVVATPAAARAELVAARIAEGLEAMLWNDWVSDALEFAGRVAEMVSTGEFKDLTPREQKELRRKYLRVAELLKQYAAIELPDVEFTVREPGFPAGTFSGMDPYEAARRLLRAYREAETAAERTEIKRAFAHFWPGEDIEEVIRSGREARFTTPPPPPRRGEAYSLVEPYEPDVREAMRRAAEEQDPTLIVSQEIPFVREGRLFLPGGERSGGLPDPVWEQAWANARIARLLINRPEIIEKVVKPKELREAAARVVSGEGSPDQLITYDQVYEAVQDALSDELPPWQISQLSRLLHGSIRAIASGVVGAIRREGVAPQLDQQRIEKIVSFMLDPKVIQQVALTDRMFVVSPATLAVLTGRDVTIAQMAARWSKWRNQNRWWDMVWVTTLEPKVPVAATNSRGQGLLHAALMSFAPPKTRAEEEAYRRVRQALNAGELAVMSQASHVVRVVYTGDPERPYRAELNENAWRALEAMMDTAWPDSDRSRQLKRQLRRGYERMVMALNRMVATGEEELLERMIRQVLPEPEEVPGTGERRTFVVGRAGTTALPQEVVIAPFTREFMEAADMVGEPLFGLMLAMSRQVDENAPSYVLDRIPKDQREKLYQVIALDIASGATGVRQGPTGLRVMEVRLTEAKPEQLPPVESYLRLIRSVERPEDPDDAQAIAQLEELTSEVYRRAQQLLNELKPDDAIALIRSARERIQQIVTEADTQAFEKGRDFGAGKAVFDAGRYAEQALNAMEGRIGQMTQIRGETIEVGIRPETRLRVRAPAIRGVFPASARQAVSVIEAGVRERLPAVEIMTKLWEVDAADQFGRSLMPTLAESFGPEHMSRIRRTMVWDMVSPRSKAWMSIDSVLGNPAVTEQVLQIVDREAARAAGQDLYLVQRSQQQLREWQRRRESGELGPEETTPPTVYDRPPTLSSPTRAQRAAQRIVEAIFGEIGDKLENVPPAVLAEILQDVGRFVGRRMLEEWRRSGPTEVAYLPNEEAFARVILNAYSELGLEGAAVLRGMLEEISGMGRVAPGVTSAGALTYAPHSSRMAYGLGASDKRDVGREFANQVQYVAALVRGIEDRIVQLRREGKNDAEIEADAVIGTYVRQLGGVGDEILRQMLIGGTRRDIVPLMGQAVAERIEAYGDVRRLASILRGAEQIAPIDKERVAELIRSDDPIQVATGAELAARLLQQIGDESADALLSRIEAFNRGIVPVEVLRRFAEKVLPRLPELEAEEAAAGVAYGGLPELESYASGVLEGAEDFRVYVPRTDADVVRAAIDEVARRLGQGLADALRSMVTIEELPRYLEQ